MSNRPIFFQETEAPVRRPSGPSPFRWLGRLVTLVLVLVAGVVMVELGARLIFGRSVVLFSRFHVDAEYGPYHLWRLQPSTTFKHTSVDGTWSFETNAQGFRDVHNYAYEKSQDIRRVLCLGDSHTQGFEARRERIFPSVIEERLKRMGHQVEVLNSGIAGFGTAEELVFFENEGIRYKPDVVVLGWSLSDLHDNENSGLFSLKDGVLSAEKFDYAPGVSTDQWLNSIPGLKWASQHSYAYGFIANRVGDARTEILANQRNTKPTREELASRITHQGVNISAYQLELSAELVKRLHEVCKKHGIRLLIVDIPWLPQDNTGFGSSLPAALAEKFEENSDELLRADDVLGPYRGVADIFVSHGQHHISETSHLMIGMAAAQKIANWWRQAPQQ